MSLITCPECESKFTEQQLKDAGMCPSCGLPEAEVRKHMPPPPPPAPIPSNGENYQSRGEKPKSSTLPGPNDPDAPYKTTASKMLAVFAWVIWAGGAIGSFALSIKTQYVGYTYTYTEQYFDVVTFLVAAFSTFVAGALFFAASRALVDLRAVRMNLEQLNGKKEG